MVPCYLNPKFLHPHPNFLIPHPDPPFRPSSHPGPLTQLTPHQLTRHPHYQNCPPVCTSVQTKFQKLACIAVRILYSAMSHAISPGQSTWATSQHFPAYCNAGNSIIIDLRSYMISYLNVVHIVLSMQLSGKTIGQTVSGGMKIRS